MRKWIIVERMKSSVVALPLLISTIIPNTQCTTLDVTSQGITNLSSVLIPPNTTEAIFLENSISQIPVGVFKGMAKMSKLNFHAKNGGHFLSKLCILLSND